jgi:hypothetical protein
MAIGTVAHNRPFTVRDLSEYVGFDASSYIRGWKKRKLLESVGSDDVGRGRREKLYFPTSDMWLMIEGAVG